MTLRYSYSHPRPAVTVDIAVLSRDRAVLLIQRKSEPFKGSWALPGGFIRIDETLARAAARELEEETGLRRLPLHPFAVLDAPRRDPRGRTISVAFLAPVARRRRAHAASDAAAASWFPIDRLPTLAFDHADIIACAAAAAGLA